MKAVAILLLISYVLLLGCSQNKVSEAVRQLSATSITVEENKKESDEAGSQLNYEVIKDIRYEANCLSAIDFLTMTGRAVQSSDINALEKEMVILFTMSDTSVHKNIKENKRIIFSDEELHSYLQQEILSDFMVLQNGKIFFPIGVQSDNGGVLHQNKISTLLFFDSIDMKQKFTIQYNDQLFGAGLLRINSKKLML